MTGPVEYEVVRARAPRPAAAPSSLLRIAFGDRPGAAPPVHRGSPSRQRWLAAVALGAQGRYAAAAALLDGLCRSRAVPHAVRAHAAVTRASHLRQLGGHLLARRWDSRGLALASPAVPGTCLGADVAADVDVDVDVDGLGLEAARLDALIGLAADAVGLADLELADRLLIGVERSVVQHISWRPSVRLLWVRAELALSNGRASDAVRCAREAVTLARSVGAVRHEIKSELVLLVAESAAGAGQDEVVTGLNLLLERTRQADLVTLEWVIHVLLASVVEASDASRARTHHRRTAEILAVIRLRTDSVGRYVLDRSPWVPKLGDL